MYLLLSCNPTLDWRETSDRADAERFLRLGGAFCWVFWREHGKPAREVKFS